MSKSHSDSGLFLTHDLEFIHQTLDSDPVLKQQLEEWVPAGENLYDILSLLIDSWHN